MSDSSINDMNLAERLVTHALMMSSEPDLAGQFSTGVNLSEVRSAKLYIIGEQTNMGSSTIVEAKDKNGKVLGSFLGGFLVAPCK